MPSQAAMIGGVHRLLPILLALVLAGCAPGFVMGLREDKEDQTALRDALAHRVPARPFPARVLLPGRRWTRLWAFEGHVPTQAIEDRIGIPFPQSGEPTSEGRVYLVFDDGKAVVSSFTLQLPPRLAASCLPARRVPLGPSTSLVITPSAVGSSAQLRARAGARACR